MDHALLCVAEMRRWDLTALNEAANGVLIDVEPQPRECRAAVIRVELACRAAWSTRAQTSSPLRAHNARERQRGVNVTRNSTAQ